MSVIAKDVAGYYTLTATGVALNALAPTDCDAPLNILRGLFPLDRYFRDFVVAAAEEAAQKTVAELELIRLSRAAQEKFAELLLHPPAPLTERP